MQEKKLFIIDAMALIYRAFYAVNKSPRINSKGLNTSAILGFSNVLWSVIMGEKPTHIVVACDSQAPTFRHQEYEQYKANRLSMPEDIAASLPWIDRILQALRIPKLIMNGYEADDIIGTIAKQAEKQDFTVYMMSSDKDLGQLITKNILMYRPGKIGDAAEVLGEKEICEKFGVSRPNKIIDLLGLWGDSSDNIPGVPGVGEKTAQRLLQQFDSIENIIERKHEIQNQRLREQITKYADQAIFSKHLATIMTDIPIVLDENQIKMKTPDEPTLKQVLDELEFRQLAQRIFTDLSLKNNKPQQSDLFNQNDNQLQLFEQTSAYSTIKDVKTKYYLITSIQEAEKLAEKLFNSIEISFDTETTGIDINTAELVGISFAITEHEAWFVYIPESKQEALRMIQPFKNILENEDITKIGQNLKFDISILKKYDVDVKGKMFDTMIAHYLLQPESPHNMNKLAVQYLNYDPIPIEALIGKSGKNQINMRIAYQLDPESVKDYACEDADITLQLKNKFLPLLENVDVMPLFWNIEMPLIKVLASMEMEGIKIDNKTLKQYSTDLSEEINQIENEIYKLAGKTFNIASTKQLGAVLFEDLKIASKAKKTKTGQYATGEEILLKMKGTNPIIEKILNYRTLTKLKSTYADALPELIGKQDGHIHTSFNQTVTSTGRLSSTNPNLQNIPVRTELGREIRKAFVPRNNDFLLLAADYSQIELRVIAHISGDAGMKEDFIKGLDIHTATASKVFNIPQEEVSREQRRMAKTINFGIIYGISAFGLSERLGISRTASAQMIEQYFIKYPDIKTYMDKQILFAQQHGYVETLMGRRRYLPDIGSRNANIRAFAERNAINAPIQGSAADLIKIAMINILNELHYQRCKSQMILQVHDELVFDLFKPETEIVQKIIQDKMENALSLSVPLVVDINIGQNWLEAH